MRAILKFGVLVPVLALGLLFRSPCAGASMVDGTVVDIATEVGGYHLSVMAQPSAVVLEDFVSSAQGTVTLTTNRYQWGDVLSELTTNVFVSGSPALALNGAGSLIFNIAAGQVFSTSLKLATTGPRGYGMAGYDITFAPSVAPVPLPAGIWFLASGLGLLAARARCGRSPGRIAA